MPPIAAASEREGRAGDGAKFHPHLRARPQRARAVAVLVAMAAVTAGLATAPAAWAQPMPDAGVASPDGAAALPAERAVAVEPAVVPEPGGPPKPVEDSGSTGRPDPIPHPRLDSPADALVDRTVVSTRRAPPGAGAEDLTASASVIVPDQSPRAIADMGTLLLEVPGANVTRRGGVGALATLSLRGSNPEEVRFYIDGVPLNQAVGGAVDLSTLPLGDVERVEIYRGSSPIAFAQSALGGVVSIATRAPGPFRASLRGGAGSFGTRFADATVGGRLGPLRLYAGVHTLNATGNYPQMAPMVVGGYRPPTRENNALQQWDGVFRAMLPLPGRRELRAGFLAVVRDQGVVTEDNFQGLSTRLMASRALGHLSYESRDDLGASSRLRVLAYGGAMHEMFSDPLGRVAGRPFATDDLSQSLGVVVTAEKAVGAWARLLAIAEGRGEEYRPRNGGESLVGPGGHPARRLLATTGLEMTIPWRGTGIDVVPSARLELFRDARQERDPAAIVMLPRTDRALPVYRLGLARVFGGDEGEALRSRLTAKANIGRYARVPSFVELFGYNGAVVGNADLVPERGWNADVGVSVTRAPSVDRSLLASLTLFGATVEDLIAWRAYSYQTRAENLSRARVWGVETELRARLGRFGATAQATLTDARDRGNVASSAGQQIPYHPRYRGYGRAEWRQPVRAFVWSAYADAEGVAGMDRAPRVPVPARALLGLGLAVEHPRAGLRLVASAANLGDNRGEDFLAYPLPGRSIFVSLGWSGIDSVQSNSNP